MVLLFAVPRRPTILESGDGYRLTSVLGHFCRARLLAGRKAFPGAQKSILSLTIRARFPTPPASAQRQQKPVKVRHAPTGRWRGFQLGRKNPCASPRSSLRRSTLQPQRSPCSWQADVACQTDIPAEPVSPASRTSRRARAPAKPMLPAGPAFPAKPSRASPCFRPRLYSPPRPCPSHACVPCRAGIPRPSVIRPRPFHPSGSSPLSPISARARISRRADSAQAGVPARAGASTEPPVVTTPSARIAHRDVPTPAILSAHHASIGRTVPPAKQGASVRSGGEERAVLVVQAGRGIASPAIARVLRRRDRGG